MCKSIIHELDLSKYNIRKCDSFIHDDDINYDDLVSLEETLEDINNNKYLMNLAKTTFKKGDILMDSYYNNRNDGKFIYDGEQFIDLYNEIDEYGSAPDILLNITEVPLDYWINSISHNSIVWCDLSSMEFINTVLINNDDDDEDPFKISTFVHNNTNYAVIYKNNEYNEVKNTKLPYYISIYSSSVTTIVSEYIEHYNINECNVIETIDSEPDNYNLWIADIVN